MARAGVDGYCPLAAYLGSHGFCLELALRPGVQHSAWATRGAPTPDKTDFYLERVIPMAQRLSAAGHGSQKSAPILARLDSGFDSVRLMRGIESCNRQGMPQVDWLIKWNPRVRIQPLLAAVIAGARRHHRSPEEALVSC